jgi:hypothetical protein
MTADADSAGEAGVPAPEQMAARDALVRRLAEEVVAAGRRDGGPASDALRKRLDEARRHARRQRRRADDLERELEALRGSETWRVGVAVMRLPRWVKRRARGS